jgi:hypothetical protein
MRANRPAHYGYWAGVPDREGVMAVRDRILASVDWSALDGQQVGSLAPHMQNFTLTVVLP